MARPGRAPEYFGWQLTGDQALQATENYLGSGYTEVSSGRFVSSDGLRQVRLGAHEVNSATPNVFFEVYDNGYVVENTSVNVVP